MTDHSDVIDLIVPACRALDLVFQGTVTIDDAEKLDELLGVDWYKQYHKSLTGTGMPLDEEAATLLRALAGPHGKAILRAYRIKKGLERG